MVRYYYDAAGDPRAPGAVEAPGPCISRCIHLSGSLRLLPPPQFHCVFVAQRISHGGATLWKCSQLPTFAAKSTSTSSQNPSIRNPFPMKELMMVDSACRYSFGPRTLFSVPEGSLKAHVRSLKRISSPSTYGCEMRKPFDSTAVPADTADLVDDSSCVRNEVDGMCQPHDVELPGGECGQVLHVPNAADCCPPPAARQRTSRPRTPASCPSGSTTLSAVSLLKSRKGTAY